ncbi:MAG TPA: PHP domain-containing protein [Burkholderiales bacterium]
MTGHDFHTHSTYSDGTLAPGELVERAHANGVHTLALTDHDATDGIAEARAAAAHLGLRLVPGVEISVTWKQQTVHVVGLGVDVAHAPLQAGLARLREFRAWRAQEIGRRLRKKNIEGAYERARGLAKGAVVSRTHFARDLVRQGFVATMGQAFKQYLGRGRVAHVPGRWAALEEAVGWIRGAGGIAVVAHPARYALSGGKLRRLLEEFRACGGEALEVISGAQPPAATAQLARLALELELFASAGSDYHGPEQQWIDVGRLPALPSELTPVCEAPALRGASS